MNAEQIKKYTWSNPPNHPIPRTINVMKNYEQYLKSEKSNMFLENIKRKLESSKVFFEFNMFPYDIEPPMKHSCLWYKDNLTPQEVEEYLNKYNINYITFFENPNYLKSIKQIPHYHIFHY